MHKYFHEFWHKDKELHDRLGLTKVGRISKPMVIYGDTDSCFWGTSLNIQYGDKIEKIIFKDLFSLATGGVSNFYLDNRGNEIIEPVGMSTLNYIDNNVVFSPIKKIIRHKVRKPKWKIITETGKEVIVTNDHSITVFRNNKKLHIKASEINIETDQVLEISIDI